MTHVEPIGDLRYVVDNHESNEGWLEHNGESGRRWVAKIRWNGEPLEAKQTATGKALAQAPEMLAAARDLIENGSWHDDGSFVYWPPTDVRDDSGAIGKLEDCVERATHHIEEREVD